MEYAIAIMGAVGFGWLVLLTIRSQRDSLRIDALEEREAREHAAEEAAARKVEPAPRRRRRRV